LADGRSVEQVGVDLRGRKRNPMQEKERRIADTLAARMRKTIEIPSAGKWLEVRYVTERPAIAKTPIGGLRRA